MIRATLDAARAGSCTNSRYSVLGSSLIYEADHGGQHFHIPVRLSGKQRHKDITAMVDSGATTKFLNRRFVKDNKVTTRKLKKPIPLYNIDGSENRDGTVSEVAVLDMTIGTHRESVVFIVTDIGEEDVIIGLDWLREHNPDIDWERGSLRLSRCPASCPAHRDASVPVEVKARDTGVRPTARSNSPRARKARKVGRVCAAVMVDEVEDEPVEAPVLDNTAWDGTEQALIDAWKDGRTLRDAPQLFVSASYTYSQQLAEQEYKKKEVRSIEEMVLPEYQNHLQVFSEEAAGRMPESRPYDHAIELVPGARTFHSKLYPLSPNEQVELDKFLKENLAKGYIRESKSPMSSPFFFVKKKDGSLRPVQDYRRLNEITVKNRYPLPLVAELMDRLKNATIFTTSISQINFFLSLVNAKRVLFSPLVIVGFQIFERPSGGRYGGRWISDGYFNSNIW